MSFLVFRNIPAIPAISGVNTVARVPKSTVACPAGTITCCCGCGSGSCGVTVGVVVVGVGVTVVVGAGVDIHDLEASSHTIEACCAVAVVVIVTIRLQRIRNKVTEIMLICFDNILYILTLRIDISNKKSVRRIL